MQIVAVSSGHPQLPYKCLAQTLALEDAGFEVDEEFIQREEGPYVFIHQVLHCGVPCGTPARLGEDIRWTCPECGETCEQTAPAGGLFHEIGNRLETP